MPKIIRIARHQIGRNNQSNNKRVLAVGRVILGRRAGLEKVVRLERVAVGDASAVKDQLVSCRREIVGIENGQIGAVVQIRGAGQFINQRVGGGKSVVDCLIVRIQDQQRVIRRVVI